MIHYIMIGLLLIILYMTLFKTEGFTVGNTPMEIESNIKSATETLYGNLNINAYKSNYTNFTNDLVRWADYSMLTTLTQGKFDTEDSMTQVRKFNDLYTFKQNVMDFNKTISSFS
jgi:hypothetical protein